MIPISGEKRKGATLTGPGKRERGPTSGSEGAKATAALPRALVKVGDGQYSLFKHAELLSMERAELLKKLAKDDVFRVELKDVPLSKCIVRVVTSKSKLPSPAEETGGADLLADDVLSDHAPKDSRLFIRVHLPGAAAGKGEQPAGLCCAVLLRRC